MTNYATKKRLLSESFSHTFERDVNYIIPPIPPMPAIADISGAAAFSSGISTTAASVGNNI